MLQQFAIFKAKLQYRDSEDERPWIIITPQWRIDKDSSDFLAVPVSGQTDLYDSQCHFMLEPDHFEFSLTKLGKRCYAILDYINSINSENIIKWYGQLEGSLAQEFMESLINFLESE